MRVALYLRVSTDDKGQTVENQRMPLSEFYAAQGWTEVAEYADEASATDLRGRVAWRQLLDDAAGRKVDLILVWRLDRAFRSVLDAAQTLERARHAARAGQGGDGPGPASGRHVGRPPVTARPGFAERWAAVRAELEAGRIGRSEAARRLDVGYATLFRLLGSAPGPTAA